MHLTYLKRMSFPKSNLRSETLIFYSTNSKRRLNAPYIQKSNLRSETLIPATTTLKYTMTTQTILGISAGFHDAAVTVLKDDKIQFASHSERYSKNKHDEHLCKDLLRAAFEHCDNNEPDVIAYYEKPILKKLRQLYAGQYAQAFYPHDITIKHYLNEHFPALNLKESTRFEHFSHHLSHAASSFQTSPFTKATVIVIDAIGEWDTVSIMAADYNPKSSKARYKTLWKQRYPHSIGLFYSAMTQAVGLRPLDEEYILMGMAAYGGKNKVRHDESVAAMLNLFVTDLDSAQFRQNLHLGSSSMENDLDRINSINCPPINLIDSWPQDPAQCNYDLAASAQTVVELLINAIMRKAKGFGWSNNLCYGGGVALNCLANRSLGEYFDNIWIMPNPGDAGSSLGAAALAYGKMIDWHGSGAPYLGHNIAGQYPVDRVLKRLLLNVNLGGGLCGVASGRAEFGPRALGNRSLLADPRGDKMKDVVNAIKQRQAFRPFAPVILAEHVHSYFELPYGFGGVSPYMQVVGVCRRPDLFPAIVHVDGTSRVQTVDKNCKSGIRWLLEAWYAETGCPMLLNTSLNIRGEPMVNDLSDARRFEDSYGVKVFS
jgi:carbamoyltransferase